MRLTTEVSAASGALPQLLGGGALYGLPAVEAVPPELIRRADLIGESEGVDPAFLLGTPPAVTCELEYARFSSALDSSGPDEVGASRACVDVQALDRPFRVRVKNLVDEAEHLDARDDAGVGDRFGLEARCEREDVGLETIAGGRPREESGVNRHGRNISKRLSRAGATGFSLQTKLTGGSAQQFRE